MSLYINAQDQQTKHQYCCQQIQQLHPISQYSVPKMVGVAWCLIHNWRNNQAIPIISEGYKPFWSIRDEVIWGRGWE